MNYKKVNRVKEVFKWIILEYRLESGLWELWWRSEICLKRIYF